MVQKVIKGVLAGTAAAGLILVSGCLTRPVVSEAPTTKTAFQAEVAQTNIDKVDLLFMIDNSPSMGDKQDLLALAIPVLITRLINPNCVSTSTTLTCKTAADCTSTMGGTAQCDIYGNGGAGQCYVPGDNKESTQCAAIPGTKPEFPPVHDMHIGIVSSSMGNEGSPDICVPANPDTTHQDDHGYLLNRTINGTTEGSIANAKPTDGNGGNFLAWLPSSFPQNSTKTPGSPGYPNVTPYGDAPAPSATQMQTDFQALVHGVQQHGCGLEAQMESWYRFLVQPDPYQSITTDNGSPPKAVYNGVDATLLKMRHDFLRPDSLVAVIDVTDEDQDWADPMWLGGFGWVMHTNTFPGGPGNGAGPRGTSECDQPVDINNPTTTGPNNPDCVSCGFQGNKPVAGTPVSADPNCTSCAGGTTGCPKPGWYTPVTGGSVPIGAADGVNVHDGAQYVKARYGLDPHHNYQRYVDGLRNTNVPDRNNESHDVAHYNPTRNCRNPLFSENLPDGSDTSGPTLCNLTPGPRTPNLVFFAHIGGVPNTLLEDSSGNFKLNLTQTDWQNILGKDPDHYIFDGISPYMLQSIAPRSGLQAPGGTYNLGSDPVNGREWNTLTSNALIDIQFACTFPLPATKDCNADPTACDCYGTAATAPDGPPLCDPVTRTNQTRGKVYPTITELRVAKALGSQAVVASMCTQDTNVADEGLLKFGYNNAMEAIVNRLRNALSGQCLPQTLQSDPGSGSVPCLILIEYPSQLQTGSAGNYSNPAGSCQDPGMSQPTADVLQRFDQGYAASQGDSGAQQAPPAVCVFQQLLPVALNPPPATNVYSGNSCEGTGATVPGWCYVTGAQNTGGCAQAIKFSGSGPPAGTVVSLECIEQRGGADSGGGGG